MKIGDIVYLTEPVRWRKTPDGDWNEYEYPDWVHRVYDVRFLFWKWRYDYWTNYWEKYTEEEMLRKVEEGTFIFKDGILYLKPHIVLKFSENQSVIAYFNSNEEMESWARSFIDFSKKPFVYLK